MRNQHNTPGPNRIRDALVELEEHDLPGTPSVSTVKIVDAVIDLPYQANDRVIEVVDWAQGKPKRGELRSDDHVSHYHLRHHHPCPECTGQDARYDYNVYHHISGDIVHACTSCGHTYTDKHW